jgi:hypothetical protein
MYISLGLVRSGYFRLCHESSGWIRLGQDNQCSSSYDRLYQIMSGYAR